LRAGDIGRAAVAVDVAIASALLPCATAISAASIPVAKSYPDGPK
jgi:hypothetical protein